MLEPGRAIASDDQAALAAQAAVDLESLLNSGSLDPSQRRQAPELHAPMSSGRSVPLIQPLIEASDLAVGLRPVEPVNAQPTHIPLADGDALAEADRAWLVAGEGSGVGVDPARATSSDGGGDAAAGTTDDRLVALASKIASFLRDPAIGADGKPGVTEAVILAPIEALSPGSLATITEPSSRLGSRLNSQDRRTLAEARDRMASAPLVTAESIAESLRAIAPPSMLKIPRTLLCTRVSGFGKFEPFASNVFIAGTAARAIVYSEVEGFTYRTAGSDDPVKAGETLAGQQAVELEQSITLYQDVDGYQAWHKPAQKVIEVSRTRRRDFYLIQVVELPAALAIGKYNLKVTIRDVTSGSVAEAVVPVEVRSAGQSR